LFFPKKTSWVSVVERVFVLSIAFRVESLYFLSLTLLSIMSLDPEFVRRIQERKAKREAMEQKYQSTASSGRARSSGSTGGSSRTAKPKGPVYRSVSMLSGREVIITGDEAKKKAQKAEYNG
jgi:hypothetical protein